MRTYNSFQAQFYNWKGLSFLFLIVTSLRRIWPQGKYDNWVQLKESSLSKTGNCAESSPLRMRAVRSWWPHHTYKFNRWSESWSWVRLRLDLGIDLVIDLVIDLGIDLGCVFLCGPSQDDKCARCDWSWLECVLAIRLWFRSRIHRYGVICMLTWNCRVNVGCITLTLTLNVGCICQGYM